MHPLSLAEYLQAAASALAAGRVIQLGFARRQYALLFFLTFTCVDLVALASVDPASHAYFSIYMVGIVFSWVVSIFAVREMLALLFNKYRGIRTVSRWVLYGATAVAVAVSVAIAASFRHTSRHGNHLLNYAFILNRSLLLALAVVIAAMLLFLSHYPLGLTRNDYVSTTFFSAVFLSEAAVMVIDGLSTFLFSYWVDITQVYFAAICFLGWAVMLRPERATAEPRRVVFENPGEQDLLQQLDSLNSLLSRTGRR